MEQQFKESLEKIINKAEGCLKKERERERQKERDNEVQSEIERVVCIDLYNMLEPFFSRLGTEGKKALLKSRIDYLVPDTYYSYAPSGHREKELDFEGFRAYYYLNYGKTWATNVEELIEENEEYRNAVLNWVERKIEEIKSKLG